MTENTRHDEATEKAAQAVRYLTTSEQEAIRSEHKCSALEANTRAAIAAYEAHMRPVFSAFDALKELPDKSVIVDAGGFLYEKHTFPSGTVHWGSIDYLHSHVGGRLTLPARVLHWGDGR